MGQPDRACGAGWEGPFRELDRWAGGRGKASGGIAEVWRERPTDRLKRSVHAVRSGWAGAWVTKAGVRPATSRHPD